MNSRPTSQDVTNPAADSLVAAKWTRRYAQNRAIPVLVGLAVFLTLFMALLVLWRTVGVAYRAGNLPLFWGCVAGLVPANLLVIWLSVPWWGGRQLQRLMWRYYCREGAVTINPRIGKGTGQVVGLTVAILFGACLIAHVTLGFLGFVSIETQLPVSALYVVPFLVVLFLLMRPQVGYLMLLWPGLYVVHAVLMVCGVPIRFAGELEALNMLVPVAGYGFVTALVQHLYNRWALSRVRRLARGIPHETAVGGEGR